MMSATTHTDASSAMPMPGDSVPVSDGVVTVMAVTDSTVTYDHSEYSSYTISHDSWMDYAGSS